MKVSIEYTDRRSRKDIHVCAHCCAPFGKNTAFAIVRTQVNCFRGDDEVEALCFDCCDVKGIRVDPGYRGFEASPPAQAVARLLASRGVISMKKVGYWAKLIDWEFTKKAERAAAKAAAKEAAAKEQVNV